MFIGIFMFHFYTGKDYKIYILKKKIPSLMGECKLFFFFCFFVWVHPLVKMEEYMSMNKLMFYFFFGPP